MSIDVIPLSDNIGAEIVGVDLSRPLDALTVKIMLDAWHEHMLLLLRKQTLDDDQMKNATSWLGQPGQRTMPVERRARNNFDPYVMVLSNLRDSDGAPLGSISDGELWFHHDNSFVATPHKATSLLCMANGVEGGHTIFANGYVAYESLPQRLKQAIDGRRVLQIYDNDSAVGRPDVSKTDVYKNYWQPAVVLNPDTGKRALYIDRLMTGSIEGYSAEESEALLNEMFPYVERNDYEHVWSVGDYLMWDNRCSAHMRTDFEATGPRVLKRTTVVGDKLIAAPAQFEAATA